MRVVDPTKVSEFLKEGAERFIMPRFQALKDEEISTKTGPNDLVTLADIETEAFLVEALPSLLPGSVVIGEEGVSSGKMSLDSLKQSEVPVWVVDPVDGTFNFVKGRDKFGVMVALIVNGETRMGWIYNILKDEMSFAEAGEGAYCNDDKLTVNSETHAADLSGFINPRYFPKKFHEHVKSAMGQFKHTQSLGCAAHEYLGIASGEQQFSVYSRLKPWDHLAGTLILQEAGGYAAKWDGSPYKPGDDNKGLIVAASEENWQHAFDAFVKDLL